MRVLITGEKGFLATNLRSCLEERGHWVADPKECKVDSTGYYSIATVPGTDEACVYRNSEGFWTEQLIDYKIDAVVHMAAVVGTDVVALDPKESTLTNVQGTYNICRAAAKANVPVCFTGTTVIYDAKKYQDAVITECSDVRPNTYYGCLKLAGEEVVKTFARNWMIVRPLFAFGGIGDNNSLVAKSVYAWMNDKQFEIYLDPEKIKDYLYVDDFSRAVMIALEKGLWRDDWNVAAETPCPVGKIIDKVSLAVNSDVRQLVKFRPETDYLGNHRLSAVKFRTITAWSPEVSLTDGIHKVVRDQMRSCATGAVTGYDPLKYHDRIQHSKMNVAEHFAR